MDDNERVIDYIRGIGEYIMTSEGRVSASQMLERFLFTPDMQYAPIGKLSGGEKQRLYLLGVLCRNMNVLLLDEAGSNLDIPTLTILEDYLNSFSGIVIAVSHDRYFLDNIADRILAFDGEGHLRQYEGGYTDYLEACQKLSGDEMSRTASLKDTSASGKASYAGRKQNRPVRLRFTYKEQREFETIDADIAALEDQIKQLDEEILANATNSARLNELTIQREAAEAELDHKMERWVYLNELAEKIEAQDKK